MVQSGAFQLTADDIEYLLTLLRNATAPLTTAQLIDAVRTHNA